MPWNKVMDKWKSGTLKSGGSGKPVKSQAQAIAIMLSEKRAAARGKKEYAATPITRQAGLRAAHASHPNASRLGQYLHPKKAR